jgi:Zn-dependent peptidase ImmA (M78 family)/DNA-binding XRE family transcriptional regulator
MSKTKPDPRLLGQRLTDARKAAGKTQQDACDHLGISRPTLIAVEKGEREPKPDELIRLAELYGRSVHELVRPGVPAGGIEPHLRAVVLQQSAAPLPRNGGATDSTSAANPELAEAIRELQRFAEDYNELESLLEMRRAEAFPPQVRVPTRGIAAFAESVATAERARLGLGDQPIRRLREVLESSVGLRIIHSLRLPSNVAGMYAYAAELGYCIVVNCRHPRERRRATLAHEYGHFLAERHRPGIDYLQTGGRKPAGERFAEAFGMGFLMPSSAVQRQFFETVSARKDFQVADLCRLSHYFDVSVQAMTLRLEALGLVSAGTWDYLQEEGFRVREAQESLGLSRPSEEPEPPFSDRYKYLAVQAFENSLISEGRLAKLLRTDRITARGIVARCLEEADVEESGATTSRELRFDCSLLHSQKSA